LSSLYVRSQIKAFLATNAPTEKVVDLTGEFEELEDILAEAGIGMMDDWVGVQFVGSDEVPISVGSTNTKGKYRETGAVHIHVVSIAKLGVSDTILARAETLRDLFRGQRIGTMFIESVTPSNFEAGAALRFEDGFMSGAFLIGYQNDKDL
jgi:hypothetical protein